MAPGTDLGAIYARLKQTGLNAARYMLLWQTVEKTKGDLAFDGGSTAVTSFLMQAHSNGIDPVVVLAYGNRNYDAGEFPTSAEAQDAFVRYAKYVATYFKGTVKRYEVWNEPNIGAGIPSGAAVDPVTYTQLLKKVYAGLKSVDPDIVVLGGSIAPQSVLTPGATETWSQAVFRAGGLAAMDGFSMHPYTYPYNPEKAVTWLQTFEGNAKAAAGGKEVPLYVSEIGWTNYQGQWTVSPSVAADYVARFHLVAPMFGYVKGSWYFNLVDGTDITARDQNFGLYHSDYSAKPTACAMNDVGNILASNTPISVNRDSRGVWIVRYTNASASTFIVWTEDDGTSLDATISATSPSGATLTARGICKGISVTGNGSTLLHATITNSPMVFTTVAAGLSVQ
jgi:hypothetical protein